MRKETQKLSQIKCNETENVVTRSIDADVLIIILGNMYHFSNLKVWMGVERSKKQFIDIY